MIKLARKIRLLLRVGVRKLWKLWYKLVTLKSSPRRIAGGFAVGLFIAYTPTFGFQTALAVGLAALLRVNAMSAVVGVWVTNHFTAIPIYYFCYRVGGLVTGSYPLDDPEVFGSLGALLKAGPQVLWTEFVGGVVVGLITCVPAYFLMLWGVVRYRRVRLGRKAKKMRSKMGGGEEG